VDGVSPGTLTTAGAEQVRGVYLEKTVRIPSLAVAVRAGYMAASATVLTDACRAPSNSQAVR